MLTPGSETPPVPDFVHTEARVGHNLLSVIAESDASAGIGWAQQLMTDGLAEEYALAATTLEDAYIRLTGHTSEDS
jgi:ABC-2 type transport system ATP-binding protein